MGLRAFLDNLLISPNPIIDVRVDDTPMLFRGAFDAARVPDWQATRQANWSPWEWDSDRMRDAARKSVTVFACATVIGDAVAEAHLQVERRIKGAWDLADDRPSMQLQALLDRPNPYMEDAEFLSLLVFQAAIMGYAVVEKTRSAGKLPVELWPLRADWLTQKREGSDYEYKVGNKPPRTIPADDLIWLPWRHDDKMERRGVSPVTVAAREIGIDTNLTDWLKAFLDAGGIPAFVLQSSAVIQDEAAVEVLQEKWRQKYGGSKAYGSLPVLHGEYQLIPVGGDVNAMAWPDLRGLTELKICSAFRVPPGLIGAKDALFSGSLTTTEMDGDMTALQRYGAEPLRNRFAAGMGRALLPDFGLLGEYRLAFDTSQVRSLQEDTDALHMRVREDFGASLIMLDEARMAMGLDPLPNKQGQVFSLPFSTMMIPATSLAGYEDLPAAIVQSQTPSAADTPKPLAAGLSAPNAARKYISDMRFSVKQMEFRTQAQARIDRDRKRLIRDGQYQIGRMLKAQGQRLSEQVAKAQPNHNTKDLHEIDWDYEEQELARVLNKFYMANGEAAFTATAGLTGTETVWQLVNPRIAKLMQELGLRITAINESTRQTVQQIVTQGYLDGKPVVDIARDLGAHIEETYAGRALTIARTESVVAYGRASVLGYAESGVVDEVEFSDNPDHTEDYGASDGLSCAERDGLICPLYEADGHLEAEHPNGSAFVIPILSTPLGDA